MNSDMMLDYKTHINLLTNSEKLLIMELISECHFDSKNVIKSLPEKLARLLPYEMFAYGHGRVRDLYVYNYVNLSFPQSFLTNIVDNKVLHCGLVKNWMQNLKPMYFSSDSQSKFRKQSPWINSLRENEIKNIACHGMIDGTGTHVSTFGFAQFFETWNARISAILTILTPHLHHALVQPHQLISIGSEKYSPFSTREHEVMLWMAQGKSNWEIGMILGISESTVRIHVQNILEKLQARNRAHAVALAIQRGAISV